MRRIKVLEDIVDWRLCLGCGACKYICPEKKITLINRIQEGIRPIRKDTHCKECSDCIKVCPAVHTDFSILFHERPPTNIEKEWGALTNIWEGYASDREIRFKGSSGGALTALSLFCIEKLGMTGTLHTGEDNQTPLLNKTRLSTTRKELRDATGSRYSPASVCDTLELIEDSPDPCVIIGRPAEIAGLRNAMTMRPSLAAKVGVSMSFFCAETPSTLGTQELLKQFNEKEENIVSIRYRGMGWPGYFNISDKHANSRNHWIYHDSWAFLQKFRPWSTQMWPDGSGELADIVCGDPWYTQPDGNNPGFSLIVTRTSKGEEIVRSAIREGYLTISQAEEWKLAQSQSGLLKKKASIFGRRLTLNFFGLPTTQFSGAYLFHTWCKLPFLDKIRSTFGTARRLIQRGYLRRQTQIKGESV